MVWKNTTVDLPNSITRAGLFQIFFSFKTGDSGNNAFKGWFIDNVKLDLVNTSSINPLTPVDIPNLDLSCDPSSFDSTTSCRFSLPAGKSFLVSLKIQISNSVNSSECVLGTQTNLVECLNVITPNSVGFLPISVILDGASIDSTKTVKISGPGFSKAKVVFIPQIKAHKHQILSPLHF